jgi:hypothetical protein
MKGYLLLIMAVILSWAFTTKYTLTYFKKPYIPIFHAGDCFRFKHSDDKLPDGIVKYLQEDNYIILWAKEANRRYAGPKEGGSLSIRWLDEWYVQTECPRGWR